MSEVIDEFDRIYKKYGAIYGSMYGEKEFPVRKTSIKEISERRDYFLNHVDKVEIPVKDTEVLAFIAFKYGISRNTDLHVCCEEKDFLKINATYHCEDCNEYDTPFYVKVKDGLVEYVIIHPSFEFCELLGVSF